MGELAGASGNGRRIGQTLCASVLHVPISLGAMQKVLDRVSQAIEPHDRAMATQTRHAPGTSIDETPWFLTHTLQWLWVLVSDTAAFSMIHPHRSKEAFAARIDDWAGILVSDGYGVSQHWVQARHTCVAHLLRSARGLAARAHPALAACGTWALAELQRLCHRATAPPTGGEWRAWYARRCTLIAQ
jgi:transposase